MARLRPGEVAAGPPRVFEILTQWNPGFLRDAHIQTKRGASAWERELAVNGLVDPKGRFQDMQVLGKGAFGVVHRAYCKRTKRMFAIKRVLPVSH